MDPTETLIQIRALIGQSGCEDEIVELFQGLDDWLTKGGFLPAQWTQTRISGW